MSDDYEVGYGKPPKHSQFKKGQSGHPGRAKGSKNLATVIRKELAKKVAVTDDRGRRMISKFEVAIAMLVNKAVKGDHRSMTQVLALWRQLEADAETSGAVAAFSTDKDQEVLAAFLKRVSDDEAEDDAPAAEGGDEL